jgi:hypothetical protein
LEIAEFDGFPAFCGGTSDPFAEWDEIHLIQKCGRHSDLANEREVDAIRGLVDCPSLAAEFSENSGKSGVPVMGVGHGERLIMGERSRHLRNDGEKLWLGIAGGIRQTGGAPAMVLGIAILSGIIVMG